MSAELATMEGQIREIAAQVEPFKQAKEAAKKAHKVGIVSIRIIILCFHRIPTQQYSSTTCFQRNPLVRQVLILHGFTPDVDTFSLQLIPS